MKPLNTPQKPTYLAERLMENNRLVYYMDSADADYWDQQWKLYLSPESYHGYEKGYLEYYEPIFSKYLPQHGRVLEAGCGMAGITLALRARGYEAEGVDWAAETIEKIRQIRSDLPVRVGDVTHLDVPDGYYHGYISLGVVEHRREGPQTFLDEAYRVLSPEGVAFISVPYIHPLRQMKARLGLYRGCSDGLAFYQQAFSQRDFTGLLHQAGFKVVDKLICSGYKGIKDEIPFLRQMFGQKELSVNARHLQRWLLSWQWGELNLGHMILFACQKTDHL